VSVADNILIGSIFPAFRWVRSLAVRRLFEAVCAH